MAGRLRGRQQLLLALLVGVIGVVLISIGAVSLANNSLGLVDGFTRVGAATGTSAVRLDRTGSYVVYYETRSAGTHRPSTLLQLTGSGGDVVPVRAYGTSPADLVYDVHGRHGEAVYRFSVRTPGRYDVRVRSTNAAPGADLAFGKSIATGLGLGVALVVPGVLLVVVALVLLVVGLVRRGRHKAELIALHGPRPKGRYRGIG